MESWGKYPDFTDVGKWKIQTTNVVYYFKKTFGEVKEESQKD